MSDLYYFVKEMYMCGVFSSSDIEDFVSMDWITEDEKDNILICGTQG